MKTSDFMLGITSMLAVVAFTAIVLFWITHARANVNQTIETHKPLPHNKPVLLDDGHCRYLEDLNRQYAGVTLSAEQQQMRQQLFAWYQQNCRKTK